MLSIQEALRAVLNHCAPLPPRACPLADAFGCVLAEDILADIDLPPFDKSLVDGYAVRAQDLREGDAWLAVGEEIPAGRTPSRHLAPREAAFVMTGAPLPPEADAVVMLERCLREGERVRIDDRDVAPGKNRLTRGREVHAGDRVLTQGAILNPVRLGVAASVGRLSLLVTPRPSVAVVSTGDELVEPDEIPGPGQIRNSNASMLAAFAASAGAAVRQLPIARDNAASLEATLSDGLRSDILVISGGVSAGNRDLVPGTLEQLGVAQVFHKIRLKPGKPLWFGVVPNLEGAAPARLIFGLPGNPVSGAVGFVLFVRPALQILGGRPDLAERSFEARLKTPYEHRGDRPTLHPARLYRDTASGEPATVEPLRWAGSSDLRTVAEADGFACFPEGDRDFPAGEIVRFLPLD